MSNTPEAPAQDRAHAPAHPAEPPRRIRALHTDDTVTVYQAYSPALGLPAARDGRFPAAWKRERMTWIKPSFLWMMYRCGWGAKADQETVLAVEIERAGFDWALGHACLSHYDPDEHPDRGAWQRELKGSPARVQWDRSGICGCGRCRTGRYSWDWRGRRRAGMPMNGRWRSRTSRLWRTRSMRWCVPGRRRRPRRCCPRSAPTRHPGELRGCAACPDGASQTRNSGRRAVRRGLVRVAYGT